MTLSPTAAQASAVTNPFGARAPKRARRVRLDLDDTEPVDNDACVQAESESNMAADVATDMQGDDTRLTAGAVAHMTEAATTGQVAPNGEEHAVDTVSGAADTDGLRGDADADTLTSSGLMTTESESPGPSKKKKINSSPSRSEVRMCWARA